MNRQTKQTLKCPAFVVATSLLRREIATMSSSCKSVSGRVRYPTLGRVHHDRLARSQSALFIDPCISIQNGFRVSQQHEFSWLQFVVLGTKSQVFNTVNQKNNF